MTRVRLWRLLGTATVLLLIAYSSTAGEINEETKTITPGDVERLLVPICPPNDQEGRFGARWGCEMWVRNSGDVPVVFSRGGPESHLPPVMLIQIDPHTTQLDLGGASRGGIYIVEKAYADRVHLSVRIADRTRGPVSQGTEIPIVGERDWLTSPVELLNVPTDPAVRQTLRVYDPDASEQMSVRVTIYPLFEDTALAETVLDLRGSQRPSGPWYRFPDYAEITDLVSAFPQIAPLERVRVRIEPTTPGRFWAFITITDNMTQHVTVVSPQ